ncbi:alkaline serine protease [Grosmannia clavigera kw1407]|uniref:Alkaline serine protease n=1 Tax=Grosmannia clavigera (strain kw1407 / UAMH 11150) TaxID=655863 RepID=F0X876_GROCL|nr:alkaline serine protease [Grosmannia clavigera kw1407]EFX05394.1 alkaline serine protease [Grosmannia clavigera kw1407]
MLFQTLACGALLGSVALEVAASPVGQPHASVGLSSAQSQRRSIPATHAVHERQLPHWSKMWRRTDAVPRNAMLPMRIGLKQRNMQEGHDLFMSITDPKSANYGQHLTADEVVELFAPERTTIDAVVGWLTGSGIEIGRITLSANKQWLQFDAPAAEVEDLLLTKYYVFEHSGSATRDVAAEHYHLPHEIRDHVDYITPGIRLRWDSKKAAREQQKKRDLQSIGRRGTSGNYLTPEPIHSADAVADAIYPAASGNVSCALYVTPDCVKAQYQIPNATKAATGNELGIFESLNEHYNKADLDGYFASAYPSIPKGTYPIERLIDGAVGAVPFGQAGAEANLDLQAAMPLIYPQSTVLYQVDDERIQKNETTAKTPYLGFLNTFFDALDGSYCTYSAFGETGNCVTPECLDPSYPDAGPGGYNGTLQCGVFEPTNVISISYGGGEIDLPAYYWRRQCSEIMKLGLQGVSVVISSGDYGVASYVGDTNTVEGCLGTGGRAGTIFNPSSEATCPYALAVGATSLNPSTGNYTSRLTEHAAQRFASGGGFSNYFDQPAYQSSAVENYFNTVQLNFTGYDDAPTSLADMANVGTGVFRRAGRGYPDVSAIGEHYITRFNGAWYAIGGTSLAAPLWASMLNLVNEERIAAGKKTLGFINPVLYQHPEVFNDITVGSNPGCGTEGFPAAKGWDPVTGLGSPNYPKLLKLLLSLP